MYTANAETLTFLIFAIIFVVIGIIILKKIKNVTAKIVTLFIVIVISFFVWTFGKVPLTNLVNSFLIKTNITPIETMTDFMPDDDTLKDFQNSKTPDL